MNIEVKEDENGELFIEFPDDLLDQLAWKPGDMVNWIHQDSCNWIITKTNDNENERELSK